MSPVTAPDHGPTEDGDPGDDTPRESPPRESPADDLDEPTEDEGPRRVFRAHVTHHCERLLGSEAVGFAFPGGSRRDSCRVTLADGRSLIATVRDEPHRAELEARALAALAPHGAPAPRVIADNGRVLIQEDRGERRLSVALHEADADEAGALLGAALDSLLALHEAGRRAGLAARVPMLGVADWWIRALIDRPVALGNLLGIEPPAPDVHAMRDLLGVLDPAFVKWDARPANAVLDEAGRIAWIDFEHCGARNPLDDLAWLLADEYTPADPARDEALVAAYVPRFGGSLPPSLLPHYAWTMLVLHGTHRLNLVLDTVREDERGWRDPDACVRRDSLGVAHGFALRQCRRLEHHARQSSLTEPLADFFAACAEALPPED